MALENTARLEKQFKFFRELDKLKSVLRRTYLLDSSRTENSAEHSWQVALMALLLLEYANEPGVDQLTVVKMLLIHDVVEIEAGDTYIYDETAAASQEERERAAAEKLFGLLPHDQSRELKLLWQEYEAGITAAARFARAVDRFQPLYHNYLTCGKAWQEHGVRSAQVVKVNEKVGAGSRSLWEFSQRLIEESVAKGYLAP